MTSWFLKGKDGRAIKQLTKARILRYLILWFLAAAALYYLPVYLENETFFFAVSTGFAVLVLLLFILLLLVNGGLPQGRGQTAEPMRPNPFRLSAKKRDYFSKILLILITPLVLILLIDYLYLFLSEYFMKNK